MEIENEKIENKLKKIMQNRLLLTNSSSNIFYSQCYHIVDKDDVYCKECGEKIIRVFTKEEINKRPTIIKEWNKNKKPWEILEELKNEREKTIYAGLDYLSKNNLSSDDDINKFKAYVDDTYCWDKTYLKSAKIRYEVSNIINEERMQY